ncbi:MAG: hypothetical protein LUE99_02155 [Bacteroides sp.]|nr:hypothetical protein [Bacteroides sp.]
MAFEDAPDYIFRISSQMATSFGIPRGYGFTDSYNQLFQHYFFGEFTQQNETMLHEKGLQLKSDYKNKEEAAVLANDIESFYNYVRNKKYPCEIRIECSYAPEGDNIHFYSLSFYSDDKLPFKESAFRKHLGETDIAGALLRHIENYNLWETIPLEERQFFKWD